MADRNKMQVAESVSKIFAAVVIPVVLGAGTIWANQTIEKSKVKDDLLKQAIEVVFLSKADMISGDSKSFEARRAHRSYWLEIYNSLADVKLSDDFIALTNLDVDASVIQRDGTLKPGETIQARWTVTLRSNTRNLEDRQGYTGSSLGLLWGGECVKVIDSQVDGRWQTWAFVEVATCPDVAGSDRGRERRGPGIAQLARRY
jgi:hypothetical protein